MWVVGNLHGGPGHTEKYPIYGASADIVQGALVMRGITTKTNIGTGIVGAVNSTGLDDALGLLLNLHDYSVVGDYLYGGTVSGVDTAYGEVHDDPMAIFRAEVGQAAAEDDVGTSTSSGTTMTDENLDTGAVVGQGWLYCTATVSDACNGELHFITEDTDTDDEFTQLTAWSTALTNNESLILIPPLFSLAVTLNAAADKVSSTHLSLAGWAAVWSARVMNSYIQYDGHPIEKLDPTKHDALTGLNGLNVKFYVDLVLSDHMWNPA